MQNKLTQKFLFKFMKEKSTSSRFMLAKAKNLKTLVVLLLGFIILGCNPSADDQLAITPDLVVTNFIANPTTISASGTIDLKATVRNSGIVNSSQSTLRYYRSTDNIISTSDTQLATNPVSSLSAGSSSNESASVTGHSSGTMFYGACVDSVSSESNTANNCSNAVAVAIGAAPDLVIPSFITSLTTINPDGTIDLAVTIRNSGNGASNLDHLTLLSL